MLAILLAVVAPTEGATPAETTGSSKPMAPATNPGSWVTNDDYPVPAMRDKREGTSGFRLVV